MEGQILGSHTYFSGDYKYNKAQVLCKGLLFKLVRFILTKFFYFDLYPIFNPRKPDEFETIILEFKFYTKEYGND
jgi:hypothetical protein